MPRVLAITSGASGVGDGRVRYDVSRNDDDSSRTGTITVAGLTFTASQRGDD